jgi:hypothetical protein
MCQDSRKAQRIKGNREKHETVTNPTASLDAQEMGWKAKMQLQGKPDSLANSQQF